MICTNKRTLVKATYLTYLCVQYWSAVFYKVVKLSVIIIPRHYLTVCNDHASINLSYT